MYRILVVLVIAGLLLAPLPAFAGGNKTCWDISHGRICYINGHFYSLHCDRGYRVDPPGSGHRCVKARAEVLDADYA